MASLLFIHGLSNKPEKDYLLKLYARKLAHEDGPSLDGVASTLIYWADVLYPTPDTDLAAYEHAASGTEAIENARDAAVLDPAKLAPSHVPDKERIFMDRMLRTFKVGLEDLDPATLSAEERQALQYERIPLPAWLKNRLMGKFVRDAHLYFFNKEFSPRTGATFKVRDELRKRFLDALKAITADGRPVVVLSHSMGTIIAYDCLMHEPSCPEIQGLMTVGSPLGVDEVQDFFPKWNRENGFPSDKLKGPWINVYDPLDAVACADPRLANDFRREGAPVIEDVEERNWGTWRHSISKYLQGKQLRTKLASMLQLDWP
jgi:hypothetical protein